MDKDDLKAYSIIVLLVVLLVVVSFLMFEDEIATLVIACVACVFSFIVLLMGFKK